MSKYTLTYFDAFGRTETIRLIFAAAGQKVSFGKKNHNMCKSWHKLQMKNLLTL